MNTIYLLAIDWPAVVMQAGQLILALSILVIIHELGHFIAAKKFGCRVDKFYLFFNPWFSLVKKKIGETEYGIGWLPLGGYVKIAGMIDESMDKEQMKLAPQHYEFRSKPAWQRLIIMLGGIIMNVLLAIVIYAFILMTWGDKRVPASSLKYGVHVVDSTLYKIGLRNGDKVLSVNGEPVEDFDKIVRKILIGNNITVERNKHIQTLTIPVDFIGQLIENRRKSVASFLEPRTPPVVYLIPDSSKAKHSGLQKNDQVIGVDSINIQFFDELRNILQEKKNSVVQLTVLRNNAKAIFPVQVDSSGLIGFVPYSSYEQMDSLGWAKLEVKKYGFFASFPAGVKMAGNELAFYVDQVKKIINPHTGGYKGVGGFKSMGSIFPKYEWNWEAFWRITAFLSIVLAFMNLLPIPALDGGHVLFTLCEMVVGRKLNEKFLEYAQLAGMAVLLLLMIYANGNDWFGWGR